MIVLKNIKKKSETIECDIIPEDSQESGHIVVDLNEKKLKEYTLPTGYEWCTNHVHHAKRALIELAHSDNIPKQKTVMWV